MRTSNAALKMAFAGLLLAALAQSVPLPAIQWCHDYSYYRVTGRDHNGYSDDGLRAALADLKFKVVRGSRELMPGDVVIFGTAHSGFVNSQGGIDHYIQMRREISDTQSELIVVSTADVESQPTFFRNWSVERIRNFERTWFDKGTKKMRGGVFPYKNVTIEIWRRMRLVIVPANKTLKIGGKVSFDAQLELGNGTLIDPPGEVTFDPVKEFKATEAGSFFVTARYGNDRAVAIVTVEAEEKKKDCPAENEEWSDEAGRCVCKPGFTRNKEDKCVPVEEIIAEISEEEPDDICSKKGMRGAYDRVGGLADEVRANYTRFLGMAAKFNKEANDRAADLCRNGLAAYCYANAQEIAGAVATAVAQVRKASTEIIMLLGVCPDLAKSMRGEGLGINGLVASISGLGALLDDCTSKLAQMGGRLAEFACDESEVIRLGQSVVAPGQDGDFLQDGGAMVEVPGDAVDNEADGLQDESLEGLAGYNLTAVLYDSGPAKDDSFNLSVSGYGNLGTTPRGGLRSYGLNLPKGTYIATVTVISAPDNYGTFTLVILENGKRIAASSGSPAEGASVTVSFTVTGN